MTEIIYYRFAAALPVVLPLAAYALYWDSAGPPVGVVDQIATLVALSGIAGGPAYIPFAAALLWWLRKRPVRWYRRVSWVAPILFTPVFALYLLAVGQWTRTTEPLLGVLAFYIPFLLACGYGYVALVHLGRRLLRRADRFEDGDEDGSNPPRQPAPPAADRQR